MKTAHKSTRHRNQGVVLIISLICVIVLCTLAISMASLSGINIQLAENQCKTNRARSCAESGSEIIRFWLSRVSISGTTSESERCSQIASTLQNILALEGLTNITASYEDSAITIGNVTLDSEQQNSFSAVITPLDADTIQVDVTGTYGSISQTIRANYYLGERGRSVFDYGVASKGPLSLSGNVDLEGYNVSVEASVYIESENSNLALSITGNSQIAGKVNISNSIATVELQGSNAGIGGETGQDAIDNHVSFGVSPCDFPGTGPECFRTLCYNGYRFQYRYHLRCDFRESKNTRQHKSDILRSGHTQRNRIY